MRYSVQLLEDGKIHIEPTKVSNRYYPKGRVLITNCTQTIAEQIKRENNGTN